MKASGTVKDAFFSEKLAPGASEALVCSHQGELQLNDRQFKRWAGKRYVSLVSVTDVKQLPPFAIDRSAFGNMDDWLLVGAIDKVKK